MSLRYLMCDIKFSTKNISKVHFENTIQITNEESLALKSIQKWTKNN